MISSESINYSKYSKINDNNNKQSNDLEIIETKDNSFKKEDKKELSQILIVSKDNKDKDQNETNGKGDNNYKNYNFSDLYGNPYEELKPKYLGNSLALYYDKYGNPKITIGPDCKFFQ